jgi:hypothetical protein
MSDAEKGMKLRGCEVGKLRPKTFELSASYHPFAHFVSFVVNNPVKLSFSLRALRLCEIRPWIFPGIAPHKKERMSHAATEYAEVE